MRVLVVDDEKRLARSLRVGLEAEGFAVDVAHDGTDGLWLARENEYDAIVLDLMLPGINGYKVCETLRAEKNWTPILMLTAKDGEWDQVEGLDTGADDYLTKPFSFPVLVARLRAVARRGARERPTQLEVGRPQAGPGRSSRLARRGRAGADRSGVLVARLSGTPPGGRGFEAADPRGGVGRRLRGRPEHRRGLHPPSPQQDRPPIRSCGDPDPARGGLPPGERRWLRGGWAVPRCGSVRRPRRCWWWRSPCSSEPSLWLPWFAAHCARGWRPVPSSVPRRSPTRSSPRVYRRTGRLTTTRTPTTPMNSSGR